MPSCFFLTLINDERHIHEFSGDYVPDRHSIGFYHSLSLYENTTLMSAYNTYYYNGSIVHPRRHTCKQQRQTFFSPFLCIIFSKNLFKTKHVYTAQTIIISYVVWLKQYVKENIPFQHSFARASVRNDNDNNYIIIIIWLLKYDRVSI